MESPGSSQPLFDVSSNYIADGWTSRGKFTESFLINFLYRRCKFSELKLFLRTMFCNVQ